MRVFAATSRGPKASEVAQPSMQQRHRRGQVGAGQHARRWTAARVRTSGRPSSASCLQPGDQRGPGRRMARPHLAQQYAGGALLLEPGLELGDRAPLGRLVLLVPLGAGPLRAACRWGCRRPGSPAAARGAGVFWKWRVQQCRRVRRSARTGAWSKTASEIEERLVAQVASRVAPNHSRHCFSSGASPKLARRAAACLAAVVRGAAPAANAATSRGPVVAAREEVADGGEGEQTGAVSGLGPQGGQVGRAARPRPPAGSPRRGGDSSAGTASSPRSRPDTRPARRAGRGPRTDACRAAGGCGSAAGRAGRGRRARAGCRGYAGPGSSRSARATAGDAQAVQEHQRGGAAAGGVGAGEDEDALVAQPGDRAARRTASSTKTRRAVEPCRGISPET